MQEKLNNEVEAPNDLAAEEAGWKNASTFGDVVSRCHGGSYEQ